MAKFKDGDLVYHAKHGAGTVSGTRKVEVGGSRQLYYVVKLASGSELMLPVSQAECMHALRSAKAISRVLSATPENLAVDFRQRRTVIERKISSGDPLESAEVYRDLMWRDHNGRLSNSDREFMNSMRKRLIDILSIQKDSDIQDASRWLDAKLQKITGEWSLQDGESGEVA